MSLLNKKYPKVLIIGQPFNKVSGGGITISNLFNDWPKDRIVLATIPNKFVKNDFGLCRTVYCLGKEELVIRFPFNLVFKNLESGVYNNLNNIGIEKRAQNFKNRGFLYKLLLKLTFMFDLNFVFFKIKPSENFINFIQDFEPDIIYTQLGHLEFNLFLTENYKTIDIPLAIHIMDDWPENSANGIFKVFWQRKLDVSFRGLVNKATYLLSISNAMSEEYKLRYGKEFLAFHNPIECKEEKFVRKHTKGINDKNIIVYTGRIGHSNEKGLRDICIAVDKLRKSGINVWLEIYSPDAKLKLGGVIKRYLGVEICEPVNHSEVLSILRRGDLLFLPLDFDKKSIGYAKLSMPTKATEYMLSGTPILLYAPPEMGITKDAREHNWAKVLSVRSVDKLSETIYDSIINAEISYNIANLAFEYAVKNYNAENVRERFRSVLSGQLS